MPIRLGIDIHFLKILLGETKTYVKFSNEINSVECISYTDCLPPFYIISEGTNKANTVCEKCALGTFTRKKNQKTCTPYVLVPLYFVFFFVPFALLLFSGIQQLLKI